MEILNVTKPADYPQKNKKVATEHQEFEQMWEKSISGEEFVRHAHEHIKKLYALRDK